MTSKIAHLISHDQIHPLEVMALTFTNKAANELKLRLFQLLDQHPLIPTMFVGTFHSVFARLLREEWKHTGFPTKQFLIYDSSDSKALLERLISQLQLDRTAYDAEAILRKISLLKNQLIGPVEYDKNPQNLVLDTQLKIPEFSTLFKLYQEQCIKQGAMDFDDLLVNTVHLLQNNPSILKKYQQQFKHILIDEYQDTNHAQFTVIRLLAQQHGKITIVGDDAQAIFGFRGATSANMMEFEKQFHNVMVIKLEQNYRSTQSILNVANTLISVNKNQLPKRLFTKNDTGIQVLKVESTDSLSEAQFVIQCIQQCKLQHKNKYSEYCIIYRLHSQSRTFEEECKLKNIPYRVMGSMDFYERREIKDVIAYLKVVCNPLDQVSLLRIINFPYRSIGEKTIANWMDTVQNFSLSLWQVLRNELLSDAKSPLKDLVEGVTKAQAMLQKKCTAEEMMQFIVNEFHLEDYFAKDKKYGKNKQQNVDELLVAVNYYCKDAQDKSLSSYLEHISLFSSSHETKHQIERVQLMTIHASKGLEFDHVFVVGVTNSLYPLKRALQEDPKSEEEERRMFYVATTRAKKQLIYSYPGKSDKGYPSKASPFFSEVHPHIVHLKFNGTLQCDGLQHVEQELHPSVKEFISHFNKV